jgi:lipoprotein-anchoring transpeptidase ErfK/SrfK
MRTLIRAVGAVALARVLFLSGVPLYAQAPTSVYHIEPRPKTAAELAGRFTPAQIDALEMLNRRDRAHLLRADPPVPGIVVPEVWLDDPLAYSPFPRSWPAAEPHAKAIVVHQPTQAFAAYEGGRLVRWGPVSTGRKETPTPEGSFNLTWRARSRRSTDNEDWLLEWYFNFVNERGVSFHLFDLPGYPASHACVRLLLRDAQWLYGWGEQWGLDDSRREVIMPGTPVLILGAYPFGSPPAWLSLEALSAPLTLPAALAVTTVRTPMPLSGAAAAGIDRSASPDNRRLAGPTARPSRSRRSIDRQEPPAPTPPRRR